MRKLSTLVISILVSISFFNAQNLAQNPGFENEVSTFSVPYSPTGGTPSNWLRRVANIQDATSQNSYPTTGATAIGEGVWVKKGGNTSYQRAVVSANSYTGTSSVNLRIQENYASPGLDQWSRTMLLQRINTLTNASKYTISFWARVDPTASNNCKYLVPFLTDGTNKTILSCAVPLTGGVEWTQYSAIFDVPSFVAANPDADFTTAYFGVGLATSYSITDKSRYSGVLLDDFSLTTTTEGTVSITTSATAGGTVSGKGAVYVAGTEATVVAIPTSNEYLFIDWTENGVSVSSDLTYTFTANSNRNLVANFYNLFSNTVTIPENANVSVLVNEQNEIVIDANPGSKYAVYDAVGQLIEKSILNSKIIISNSKLNAGVYLVKVGNITKKVILK